MEQPSSIEEMKNIQNMFLNFIEDEENLENCYKLTNYKYFANLNSQEKCNKLIEIIYLISYIIDYHHHTTNFFTKIEQIFLIFKEDIKQAFLNNEIFNIFRHNKRILLFLFKEQIVTINNSIVSKLSNHNANYYDYFLYEILSFYNGSPINKDDDDFNIFDTKRKIGENDNYICNLIRNDQVQEFIAYVNKTNLSLSTVIQPSIFETNQFLIDKKPTLIEYSAFFGSIQIFRYLQMNKVELTSSLWIYAIHSHNPDLIHILEENKVKPNNDNSYTECFIESVKCNHTNFAEYFQNNYLQCQDLTEFSNDIIKYRNYNFFPNNLNSPNVIYNLVKYNYPFTFGFLLNNQDIDINHKYLFKTEQTLLKRQHESDVSINKIEQTLIHVAVLNTYKEIVQILVSNPKTNINDKMINENIISEYIKYENHTPLRCATHKITSSSLHLAIEKGNAKIVQILLSHPDINVNDILEIYDYENIEVRGYYAKTIKKIETNLKRTALHIALYKKNAEIAQILLSKNIQLQNEIKEKIIRHVFTTETEIIEQKTTLYIAIQNGLNDIIKFILTKCNVDVNENILIGNKEDEYEDEKIPETTALYASVENENIEIVRFLLTFPNIDVNICQKGNKSPLHLAVEKNNIDIVKLLLTNPKTDVNEFYTYQQYDKYGYPEKIEEKTLLYLAVENENIEMVKLLISQPNIDINAKCFFQNIKSQERSPDEIFTKMFDILYFAVEKNNIKIIKLLLSHPNIDITNKSTFEKSKGYYDRETTLIEEVKKSGLQLAIEQNNFEIIKLFLNLKKIIFNPT